MNEIELRSELGRTRCTIVRQSPLPLVISSCIVHEKLVWFINDRAHTSSLLLDDDLVHRKFIFLLSCWLRCHIMVDLTINYFHLVLNVPFTVLRCLKLQHFGLRWLIRIFFLVNTGNSFLLDLLHFVIDVSKVVADHLFHAILKVIESYRQIELFSLDCDLFYQIQMPSLLSFMCNRWLFQLSLLHLGSLLLF